MNVAAVVFAILSGVALIILATFVGLWLISDFRITDDNAGAGEEDENKETPEEEQKRLEEILNDRLLELQRARFAPPIVRPSRMPHAPPPPIGTKSSTPVSNVLQFGKKNRGEK
jgi:hypothetical protein